MSTDPIPHFDVDAFISDVEERPAIWDLKSDLYSDRGKKTEAWEELCLKFIPNFSEKNVAEKNKAASVWTQVAATGGLMQATRWLPLVAACSGLAELLVVAFSGRRLVAVMCGGSYAKETTK
ncbi:hypothetical protein ACJJTC_005649 [Scirpophaga incertulas]